MADTATVYLPLTPPTQRPHLRPVMDAPVRSRAPEAAARQPRVRHAWLWLCLLFVPVAGALFATAPALLSRQLWLDEIYTATLVGDPDLGHALRALTAGIEAHPPTFYLLERGFCWLAGGVNEVNLRAFALGSAGLMLGGIFLLIWRNYSFLVASTTVLTLWCHPLLQHYAFEARCYGPWTTTVVWLVYFLVRSRARSSPTAWLPVAGTAVLVCTLHYFGIITLGLVATAEFLASPRRGRAFWALVLALSAGPLALAACWPLLHGQRAALGSSTWIPPIDAGSALNFVRAALMPGVLFLALELLALALWVRERWKRRQVLPGAGLSRWGEMAGFVALGGFPIVLVVFSYIVQPVHVSRYALPGAVCLAPVIAYLASRLRPSVAVVLAAFLALLSTVQLHHQAAGYRARDAALNELAADIRANTANEPVRFWFCLPLYMVCYYHPDLAPRCCLIEPERETDYSPEHHQALICQHRLGQCYARYYGLPELRPWEKVPPEKGYYVVPGGWATLAMPGNLPPGMLCPPGWEKSLPDWTVQGRGHGLYQLKTQHAAAKLPPLNPYFMD
jgi:hypothetical protein